MEEDEVGIYYVKGEDQLADLGAKHLSKNRHRDLIKLINKFKTLNANKLINCQGEAIIFLREKYVRIAHNFYRGACTLHCFFVAGTSHYLMHFFSIFVISCEPWTTKLVQDKALYGLICC